MWPQVAGRDRSQPDHMELCLLGLEDTQEGQARMPPLGGRVTEQRCPASFWASSCLQPPSFIEVWMYDASGMLHLLRYQRDHDELILIELTLKALSKLLRTLRDIHV